MISVEYLQIIKDTS